MENEEKPIDIYDPSFVKGVFDRCSAKYIFFSYVCSFGFTERWRKQCVSHLPPPGVDEPRCFDLMAGTGEVWPHLLKRFPYVSSITAVDISSGMHRRAMDRLHQHRAHKIEFIEDDVLDSDLPDGSADVVLSTFGLKTFNSQQHRVLAQLIARTLKPGGVFSLVEASDPKGWWLAPLYRFHMTKFLPFVERIALRGAQDFAMIGTYCVRFSDCRKMMDYLREAGLEVSYRKYFFGCASGVVGRKPVS